MRCRGVTFVLIILVILTFVLRSVFTILTLLFEDASADAIPGGGLRNFNSTHVTTGPQLIPKIIHQTYKHKDIPEVWREAQQSCIDLHPDYEYILWTDDMARSFIATQFPWFLKTFDGYKYPIQRADSIRYFVLYHYGGIYIDLDDGCNRRLDPLLVYPAFLRRTLPIGISNDVMGSVPGHAFFHRVIHTLESCNHSFLLPYLTVLFSTGPSFLSIIWKEYMNTRPNEADRVRVLMLTEYKHNPWSFFYHNLGNSWHQDDAKIMFWMWAHWQFVTLSGFAVIGIAGFCLWILYCRLFFVGSRYYYAYYGYATPPASPSSFAWIRYPARWRGAGRHFKEKGDEELCLGRV